MMADVINRQTVKIVSLCILWYIISCSNSVIGKTVLTEFPFPMTMTMVQLTSVTLYSCPILYYFNGCIALDVSWKYYFTFIVPMAFGHFLSSVTSHISIWKVPVSYTHTVKATLPLFTVILSRIILKEKHSLAIYLSLMPIILGVAIATVTELSFNVIGLICALMSTMIFSLQNIFSKKVLRETEMHHLHLLQILARQAFLLFLPVWLYVDSTSIISHPSISNGNWKVLVLLLTDGILHWLQSIIAFSVLSIVTPLTYAVANASKRLFVIAASILILVNPVTWLNILGMALAVVGVLQYNRVKYLERPKNLKPAILPFSNSHLTLNSADGGPKNSILGKLINIKLNMENSDEDKLSESQKSDDDETTDSVILV